MAHYDIMSFIKTKNAFLNSYISNVVQLSLNDLNCSQIYEICYDWTHEGTHMGSTMVMYSITIWAFIAIVEPM